MSNQPVRDPSIGPTRPSLLVVAGLAAAAAGWLLLSTLYGRMPALPWLPTLTVAALAVVEGILAQNTRARIERRPGQPKVDPLAVARYAVLARASSLAGAIFAGFSAGLLGWLVLEPTVAARDDVPAAAAALAASLALVGAALWLERACRVPDRPEDEDAPGRP
ncbi:DUF3180 domain-containing protein [Spirilliplanes yamanashiensis]|uniref:Membrane protein n=1 Tax=Spirilliplanes yamanashiensis TaxID=42233 RepID=A0A8J3Y637_9ACTN|nr:DUF3180 domain-containing protein [Spirilliplanes yamanashiensis]MDP9814588.1 hypothetical protein [Spirilliplanes yamanashiensis]GIJ02240.1 membrane protein [Spirilliplanes yamanashiensis]